MQIKTKIVCCHAADSKSVKQEVNGTVILPPLVFPGLEHAHTFCLQTPSSPVRERERKREEREKASKRKRREREKERERKRERESENEGEGVRKRERERKRQRCRIVISIFKINDRCLCTF